MENYNGTKWGHNGPELITRVAKSMCTLKNMIREPLECSQLTVLPRRSCYEISFGEWQRFYQIDRADDVIKRLKTSQFAHFWNKLNQHQQLKSRTNSSTPQIQVNSEPKTKCFTDFEHFTACKEILSESSFDRWRNFLRFYVKST